MHYWAIARYDLGLTEADFYWITPAQLRALYDRHAQAREHLELLTGILASVTVNFGFCHPEKPMVPVDFMPTRRARANAADRELPEDVKTELLRRQWRALAAAPKPTEGEQDGE